MKTRNPLKSSQVLHVQNAFQIQKGLQSSNVLNFIHLHKQHIISDANTIRLNQIKSNKL